MLNGEGERNSAAQSAVNGRPMAARWRSMAAKPAATGTGRANRTR
jgi:hypothetical protein